MEVVVLLLAVLGTTIVVRTQVAEPVSIPSASMEPQLQVHDRVLVSRLAYRLHEPRRGDIVVFRSSEGERLIKRVVGLPGEELAGRAGVVTVDGRVLIEPYLPAGTTTAAFGPVAVPDGEVFVMGDNRGNSTDSRVFGPVDEDQILGRAVARIWPLHRRGFL